MNAGWLGRDRFTRTHLLVMLGVTCVTAYFSYAYFHIDELVQVIGPARLKLGDEVPGLPWEFEAHMRPWLQPAVYYAFARVLGVAGVRDVFALTFAWRLVTGLLAWGAMAAFLRTSSAWFERDEERRAHVRVATMLGFLPYLFVRTSQESASATAFTFGFAILLAGTPPNAPIAAPSWRRLVAAGAACGLAFEMRYQTVLLTIGLVAWMRFVGRISWRALGIFVAGAVLPVVVALPIDRWGYGVWTFPPIEYVRVNVFEGASVLFGSEPPFAYFWLEPSNIFAPVVVVLLVAMLVTWWRHPKHAVTWTTAPFFLVHCLLTHKEERFVFPMVMLATSFVTLAFAPGAGKPLAVARWLWERRRGVAMKALAVFNFGGMLLLALYPLGWNHHVVFARWVHQEHGDELRAYAIEPYDRNPPEYLPRVYEIEKATPADIARRSQQPNAKEYLVADTPRLRTGDAGLDARLELVYSEFPLWRSESATSFVMSIVDAYNARARAPLRPIEWRSLYRLRR
jgi:phosphatidylinositol glycan class B